MAGHILAQSLDDLRKLRTCVDLDRVVIDTRYYKYQRLMPLALRYALWAAAPGGAIIVRIDGIEDTDGRAFQVSLSMVRRWVFQALGRDVDVLVSNQHRLELVRKTPVLAPGWSAGVVFSGREQEWADLETCLKGLVAQPELGPEQGGQILVCGPPGAAPPFLAAYGAEYLDYTPPAGPRFLIGHKKNAMVAAMRGPRVAVLHARIVLEPGALAKLPREFDILCPNTLFEGEPYLSLAAADEPAPGRMPRRMTANLRNVRNRDPMRLHMLGGVYVDGGAFFTTKALFEQCPLDVQIAWAEGEDVEWSARALHNGYISDIAMDCIAHSTNSKLPPRPDFGPLLTPPALAVKRTLAVWAAGLRYLLRPRAR